MNDKEIIFFKPYLKDVIWGNTLLKDNFGFDIPTNTTGEAWLVSAIENSDSIVINGKYKRKSLKCLWEYNKDLFGNCNYDEFPLLIKFISADKDLSVQVHPDDSYAQKYENSKYGKKECWYILDCKKDADIIVGHNVNSKDEFVDLLNKNSWNKILKTYKIKPGDFIQIDPGTIHAIKNETLLLEVQQSSDITYRLYDYDRLDNGKPRKLHQKKALDVINFQENTTQEKFDNYFDIKETKMQLFSCNEYTVEIYNINQKVTFVQDKNFMCFIAIEGSGSIDGHNIVKGNSFIVPYKYGKFTISGNVKLVCAYI